MPTQLELPTEILLSIFRYLDDLDDVFHLARSCRHLHDVLEGSGNRLHVFRSVITNAPHHRYDVDLSRHLQLYGNCVPYYVTWSRDRLPLSARPTPADIFNSHVQRADLLPEDMVWSIVCRWQGLHLLYQLYCHPPLRTLYFRSRPPDWLGSDSSEEECNRTETDRLVEPIVTSQGDVSLDVGAVCPGQNRRSYQRFYQALTAQWLAVEMLWLARISVYDTPSDQHRYFVQVWKIWGDNRSRTLQEKLDVLEIFDFVWSFLGRKSFESIAREWDRLTGEYTRFEDGGDDFRSAHRSGCMRAVTQYLRPPNIIELFLCSTRRPSHSWSIKRLQYLRTLGFFDEKNGICRRLDGSESSDFRWWWYCPVNLLEHDVLVGIQTSIDPNSCPASDIVLEYVWGTYRHTAWDFDAKGHLFFREETSERIFSRMAKTLAPHLRSRLSNLDNDVNVPAD